MRQGLAILAVIALLLLLVLAGFGGMRLIERFRPAPPTTTEGEQPESEKRPIETELQEALATVDTLEKTATAVALAAAPTAAAVDMATPSSPSAPPAVPTGTEAAVAPVPPAETPTSTAAGPVTPAQVAMVPSSATASSEPACSQDSLGNPVCYPATNAIDGETSTAWRESVSKNPWIAIELEEAAVVTQITIVSGYAKIDPFDGSDRWQQNHRPRRVRVYLDEVEEGVHELTDTREPQAIEVQPRPARQVRIEIMDSYPPIEGDRPYVAISEISVVGQKP